MKSILSLIVVGTLCLCSAFMLQKGISKTRLVLKNTGEMRYLPKGPALDMTSCGAKGLLADIFWIKALNYTIRHFGPERDFPYLAQIFDVVTDLDPHFIKAYSYAGFLLTSAASNTPAAVAILTKGIKNNPDYWRLQYDLAHVYGFFAKDKAASARYFAMAAQTATNQGSNARILFDQATDYYMRDGGFEQARSMWRTFADDPDPKRKAVAHDQIKRIDAQEMIQHLQQAVDTYSTTKRQKVRSLTDLIGFTTEKGSISHIPLDPFDEAYILRNNKVSCSLFNRELYAKRLVYLNIRSNAYKKKFGYFPPRLTDLVHEKFTTEIPPSPTGMDYIYNPITGVVE